MKEWHGNPPPWVFTISFWYTGKYRFLLTSDLIVITLPVLPAGTKRLGRGFCKKKIIVKSF